MNKIMFMLMIVLLSVCVVAEPEFYYKIGDDVNIEVPCVNNGGSCSSSAKCNITINYPNGSNLINNKQMSNNINIHNYTILNPDSYGEYSTYIFCIDGVNKGYSDFKFEINNSGYKTNLYYIFGAIASLLLLGLIYIYSAFKLDDNNNDLKIPLFFVSFADILACALLTKLIQNNHYLVGMLIDSMILANGILLAYMVYRYLAKTLKEKADDFMK